MTAASALGRASDTIFALASAPGRGAIAVIRLSGERSGRIVDGLCKRPIPRQAALRALRDPAGRLLDRALVLWMPGPGSYTGEDTAELHLHGGRAVIEALTSALLAAGARPADAGEFTRRAFLAGRMSLLEAEAIADLSQSETETQRIQALRQMQGGIGAVINGWSDRLTRCLAFQEALIDFPDDGLPESVAAEAEDEIRAIHDDIGPHLQASRFGERVRDGVVFAIAGPPNVGKSLLFNALLARDAAIVSPRPGTTRDVLEGHLDLGGVAVTLVDTAGLRETEDEIEADGIERARRRIETADLVILVEEAARFDAAQPAMPGTLRVASKCDVVSASDGVMGVSALTGEGLTRLRTWLAEHARALVTSERDPMLSRARHRVALGDTQAALAAALASELPELRAEELRLARASLGRLTGQVDTEAVLDVVFNAFCIGK